MTNTVIDAPIHPVEGGSANDYDYVCGDPVNRFDLSGTKQRELSPAEKASLVRLTADCSGPDAAGADISGSASCQRFRAGVQSGDLSEFGIGFTPRRTSIPYSRFPVVGKFVRAGNDLLDANREIGEGLTQLAVYASAKFLATGVCIGAVVFVTGGIGTPGALGCSVVGSAVGSGLASRG